MSTKAITITAVSVAAAATAWVVVFGLRLPWFGHPRSLVENS